MNHSLGDFSFVRFIDSRRAIYFFAYANTKSFLVERMERETPLVHVTSAATAGKTRLIFRGLRLTYDDDLSSSSFQGLAMSTCTNPLWFLKTRLQLDQG